MNRFLAFTKKEWMEQIRTFKTLIVFLILLLFGLTSPLLAKLTPEMLKLFPIEGLNLAIPEPTWMDAYAQFFKNMTQMGVIVLLLVFNGLLSQELSKGTLINMLSKGLPRSTVILSKFTAASILWTLSYAVSALANYGYAVFLFGNPFPPHLFFACLSLWLLGELIIALLLFATTLVSGNYGGLLLTGGVLCLLLLISILPQSAPFNPITLGSGNMGLLTGDTALGDMASACIVTVVLIVLCLAGAILRFRKKQL
ncbi:ABC transporter permease [Zongyangia hominis]|uniref:ABC transporter permease n=1 Tax=Zongyangia hominis TaxID=2763677 RepID=A0A926E8Y9_9FIRM|nr:ABC transporter permease subunit [Zongyangia hominis]MBC8569398.1 ABC transporter permease [Zongyangia hominis]